MLRYVEREARPLDLYAFDDVSFVRDWYFDLQSGEALGPTLAEFVPAAFATHAASLYRPN